MASNPNSGYLARDDSVPSNNAYYQNNNDFAGFEPTLSDNANDLLSNNHWSYGNERLDVGHNRDALPSPYQGWPSTSHRNNLAADTLTDTHNAFYPKPYANNALPFQNPLYGNSAAFGRQSPGTFDAAYTNHANAGVSVYDPVDTTYSNTPVPTGTVAPGALQQRPAVNRSASTLSQQQHATATTAIPVAQQQKPLPRGTVSGHFLIVTSESLAQVTSFKRLHNFVDIGSESVDVWSTKSTIPSYLPRKSRNEISKILANTSGITSKIAKKPLKKGGDFIRKPLTTSVVVPRREIAKGAEPVASSDEEPSDDDSDSDASEEESMQAPLPAVRPSKAIEAVQYDTIKTLWRVPYRSATGDDIRKGLADFWDIVRTIRDRWKSDTLAVKAAEEAKKTGELPLLNERVSNQREMLEVALTAAISQGHKDIVEHLAENLQLVLALAQFLRDRAGSGDYSSALSKAILDLLSRCKTLTDGVLEKTTISKVLPRFLKRGDDSVRTLAKRISDNGTAAAKKKQGLTKNSGAATSQIKDVKEVKAVPVTAQKPGSPIVGLKRARGAETANDPPMKRVAGDAATLNITAAGVQIKAPVLTKRVSSGSDVKSPAAIAAAALPKKATQVVAKPSSFFANNFSGLQSAKKSTVAALTKPTNQLKPVASSPKPAVTSVTAKPVPVAPRPLFSIADTLASVSQPRKVEVAPKREESAPLETSDERSKRLRKEQRRKLRVAFKPDENLVSVRFLTPPLEDEQGPNAFDARDAGDIDSEGRMFKLHHDDMDIDEEDDADVGPINDLSRPFGPPSLVDFSTVADEERQRMYIPYGGGVQKPECPEAEMQERREANTLIAVYANASDIPPNPKGPTESVEESVEPKQFGSLPDSVLQRLETFRKSQKPILPIAPLLTADLAALLSKMPQQQPQQSVAQPQQQQAAPPASTELEKIFAQFSQGSQATQQAPATVNPNLYAAQPQQHQPAPFLNLQGLLGQPITQAQQPQQMQGFQQPAAVAGLIPENLSAMLASLQQSGPLAGLMGAGTPGFPQYAQQQPQQQQQTYGQQTGYAGAQQPQPQQQAQYPFENPERRRWIESGGAQDGSNSQGGGGGDGWQGKSWNKGGAKGGLREREPPKFVVQCKYWKENKCRKGAECTYLHTN